MHHQTRRTTLTQHFQVTQVRGASFLTKTRPLHWTRERCEHDRRVDTVLAYELVQNEMLRTAREIIEREWDGLR